MKLTFLGTGTSHGVPVIGCDCAVCKSTDPRDKRYRSSAYIQFTAADGSSKYILIDIGPDFRSQALRADIRQIDALLLTHAHADHLYGLDDLRNFSCIMSIKLVMPSNHLIFCHPFSSCFQSFPASGSFLKSRLFASGGQSIGALASASVLPMNTQD